MRNFLSKILTPAISPMVYNMMMVSVIWGFGYAFLPGLPEIQNALLHQYGTLVGINLWGFLLFVGAGLAMIGLVASYDELIKAGSMLGFICWIFVCVTYVQHSLFFALIIVGLFNSSFMAYVYLATALKLLRRVPIDKTFDPWYNKDLG